MNIENLYGPATNGSAQEKARRDGPAIERTEAGKKLKDVLIIPASYHSLEEAVAEVFRAFPLELKGKKVLLKPNMVGAYPPERAVTTHPGFISACCSYLKKAGARVTVGDNPGVMGYGQNEAVARVSGIREAAGDCYENISREVVKLPFESPAGDTAIVSRAVMEADLIISLPRFKTHLQTLISGAIKNSYGILAGGEKARFHRLFPDPKDFSRMVVRVFALRPPDLIIMDAITVMEGNGPSSKELRPGGKIIAGRDAVAVDTLMSAMMGLKVDQVPMLRAAGEMGLGKNDLGEIEVEGEWAPFPDFKLPRPFARMGGPARLVNRIWGHLFSRTTLKIDPASCQRCGVCYRQCPVGAIEKAEAGFRIDSDRCIRCYCCYEFCTYGAIRIGTTWERFLNFLIRKKEGL